MSWWHKEIQVLMLLLWLSPLLWLGQLPLLWVLLLWLPSLLWLLARLLWHWDLANQDDNQWLLWSLAAMPLVVWLLFLDWQGYFLPLAHGLMAGLLLPRWWLIKSLRAPKLRKAQQVDWPDGHYLLAANWSWLDRRLLAGGVAQVLQRRQLADPQLQALCQALGLRPRQWWPMLITIKQGAVVDIRRPTWLYAPPTSL